MANQLRIKRRSSGAVGAPASLENAELAFNEMDDILYYGKGTGGAGGTATTVDAIGGKGAVVMLTGAQTIAGAKTFSTAPVVPTQAANDNSTKAASTAYADAAAAAAATAVSIPDGDKGDVTVSGTGSIWTVTKAAKLTTPRNIALTGPITGSVNFDGSGNVSIATVVSDAELAAIAGLVSAANKIPYFTGSGTAAMLSLDTDGTLAGNSDGAVASQKAVKTYVDGLLAANDAMVFKGVIDCSTNPNYPAANRGDTYRVSVAGKIGGASGTNVEAGDILLCTTDGTAAGTQATVGANWGIIQANLDGALTTASIGSSVQAYDAGLASLAALVTSADKGVYTTALDVYATYALTAGGRALAGVAGTANTTPYFSASNTVSLQATSAGGRALWNAAGTANTFPYFSAANTVSLASITAAGLALLDDADAAAQRTTLGLGSMALQNANSVAITGGTIDGITIDGGTF